MPVRFAPLLALFAMQTFAAGHWSLPLFTADPQAVLAASSRYVVPEGADGLVLSYSVQIALEPNGKMRKVTDRVIRVSRVLAIDSVQRVQLYYSPWREEQPTIKARVITSNGQAHTLDPSTIAVGDAGPSAAGVSSGGKNVSALLPDPDLDSVVEIETVEAEKGAAFPGGVISIVRMDSTLPVSHFETTLVARGGSELHTEALRFSGLTKSATATPGGRQIAYQADDLKPIPDEPFRPGDVAPVPTIVFSNVSSWQAVAQWYAGIVSAVSGGHASGGSTADADVSERAEAIFEAMRRTVRDDGLESWFFPPKPLAPEETAKAGIGNGRDEAAYIVAKLGEAGISARVALISTSLQGYIVPQVPGFDAFNRVIVYVPGAHPLWIDPTAQFIGVNRLPTIMQGRLALVIDPGTTGLVRTPESGPTDNSRVSTVDVRLRDGPPASTTTVLEVRGGFDDTVRPLATSMSTGAGKEVEQARTDLASFGGAQETAKVELLSDPKKLLTAMRIKVEAQGFRGSQLTDDGGSVDVPGLTAANFQRLSAFLAMRPEMAESFSTRPFPFYLPPPFTDETRFHIHLPPQFQFQKLPGSTSDKIGPIEVSVTTKLDNDGSAWVTTKLVNPKATFTLQDVLAIQRDAGKLAAKSVVRLPLANQAAEQLAKHQYPEAIRILKANASTSPDGIASNLRLAAIYLRLGLRPAAMSIYEQILAKDPNNAATYTARGWAYLHDEFGRVFAPGFDESKAEKDYGKAADIEPGLSVITRLSTLYTYNSAGVLFGDGANLDRALELFRRVPTDDLVRFNLAPEYLMTCLAARQYNEIRQFYLLKQARFVDPSFQFAAVAAEESASDALQDSSFTFAKEVDRQIAIRNAAMILVRVRLYAPAVTLFQAIGGPGQIMATADYERLRMVKRFEDSTVSSVSAIATVQRFIAAVFSPPEPRAWEKLMSPTADDLTLSAYRNYLGAPFGITGSAISPADLRYWTDVVTSTAQFKVDGSDAAGYRVTFKSQMAGGRPAVVYLAPAKGELLVVGINKAAMDATVALTQIQTGNAAGARQWLQWAKQDAGAAEDAFTKPASDQIMAAGGLSETVQVRAASASLAARNSKDKSGLETLNALREDEKNASLRPLLDLSIAQAYIAQQRYRDALPFLLKVRQRCSGSKMFMETLATAYLANRQGAEANALVDELSQSKPDSIEALRIRERILFEDGKFKFAAALASSIAARPDASAADWNEVAWANLLASGDPKMIADASERAVRLNNGINPEVLRTAAILKASSGKIDDARDDAYRLLQMSTDTTEVVSVFARIAESIGLTERAAEMYGSIAPSPSPLANSTFVYAQVRLKALGVNRRSADTEATKPM